MVSVGECKNRLILWHSSHEQTGSISTSWSWACLCDLLPPPRGQSWPPTTAWYSHGKYSTWGRDLRSTCTWGLPSCYSWNPVAALKQPSPPEDGTTWPSSPCCTLAHGQTCEWGHQLQTQKGAQHAAPHSHAQLEFPTQLRRRMSGRWEVLGWFVMQHLITDTAYSY